MTDAEIDKLTLAEVRAICERAASAMAELQRLGLMPQGGGHGAQGEPATPRSLGHETAAALDEDPAAAHRRRQFQPPDEGPPRKHPQHTHPGGGLTAQERAEKERLMRARELPDDIRALEEAQ